MSYTIKSTKVIDIQRVKRFVIHITVILLQRHRQKGTHEISYTIINRDIFYLISLFKERMGTFLLFARYNDVYKKCITPSYTITNPNHPTQ